MVAPHNFEAINLITIRSAILTPQVQYFNASCLKCCTSSEMNKNRNSILQPPMSFSSSIWN